MKLSVFYHHILEAANQTGYAVEDVLSKCAQAGIQAVEMDLYHFDESINHLQLLKDAGIKTACVNNHYAMEKEFNEAQAIAHIRSAVTSGAMKILVVPGYLSAEEGDALSAVIHDRKATAGFLRNCPTAVKIAEGLRRITELASKEGVSVTVEDFDNVSSPLSGLNALLWYLEEVPGLKCTFDTGNFVTHNDDLYAAWTALKNYVTHVHVKDRGTGPVAIGDGNLPCSDILRIISEADTAQYMAIEHYGAPDQLNCILRSASYINSLAL